jgi:hypothetical protein
MDFPSNKRDYRRVFGGEALVYFTSKVKQTDLCIGATQNLKKQAGESTIKYRQQVEDYIRRQPVFLNSLEPLEPLPDAPGIIHHMCRVSKICDVGPMAAVAGAISRYVAEDLKQYSRDLIIENGGDIYMEGTKERIVGIFAGQSPLTGKIGIKIYPEDLPISICTSSGTVGHSLSFGRSDAAVIVSKDACLADAAATAAGNIVKSARDIDKALKFVQTIKGIHGTVIIIGQDMGVWGKIELVKLSFND